MRGETHEDVSFYLPFNYHHKTRGVTKLLKSRSIQNTKNIWCISYNPNVVIKVGQLSDRTGHTTEIFHSEDSKIHFVSAKLQKIQESTS